VVIRAGYDGDLVDEFDGYLQSISTDDGSITLRCEDAIYLYRVALPDKEFKNVDIKTLLEWVNRQVSQAYPEKEAFSLSCNYSFTYDRFVVKSATGYDILKKIQEEAKPNVYMKGSVLHVHPQYLEIFGDASYDFAVNIETSDLKYKTEDDRKVLVVVEYTGADGKTKKYEHGTPGGDRVGVTAGTSNMASVRRLADSEYTSRSYSGYEGSFTGWLLPYCDSGYRVSLRDRDYPYKDGAYYVLGVVTNISSSGGSRTITIGKKLSDG